MILIAENAPYTFLVWQIQILFCFCFVFATPWKLLGLFCLLLLEETLLSFSFTLSTKCIKKKTQAKIREKVRGKQRDERDRERAV